MPSPFHAELLVLSLVSASVLVGSASPAHASTEFASGPSVVEVPLESSLEVRPAEGWHYADCAALRAASPLVTACSSESFTVTGGAYDAEIAPVRVPVLLQGSNSELTVDYVIRLAEPAIPTAPDTTIGIPLTAGSVNLIPLSDLGLTCGLCTAGEATIEVGAVSPEDLGTARVTGTHLVYAAKSDAQGLVEVDLRVRDNIEAVSKTFKVMLHVSPDHLVQGSQPDASQSLHGLHLARDPGPFDLSVGELVASVTQGGTLIISACGPALHGTVQCTPGGEIHYEPGPTNPETDQFAVRLVASDGRQAIASVTMYADAPQIAPGAGAKRAKLELSLPTPPPEAEEAASGATTRFTELMDALGAR